MVEGLLAYISYDPVQRWGPISPHGVGTAVGFLAGAVLMARRAEPRGIPSQEVYNAVTWGAIGAILGARGFYVLGHLEQFETFGDVIAVWQGGLTMFGGFVGGLLLGLLYLRRRGFDVPQALDAAAPGFVVGVMVGRIGDLIIADHLGERTDFFLGYRIPEGAQLAPGYGPPSYVPGVVVHNTALYDFVGALILLGAIYVYQRRRPPVGALFAFFSLWYGLQRFGIDFTRNRELIESFFFGLSGSQWAGLAFALGGAVALVKLRATGVRPADEPEPPGPRPLEPEDALATSRPGEAADARADEAPTAYHGRTEPKVPEPPPPDPQVAPAPTVTPPTPGGEPAPPAVPPTGTDEPPVSEEPPAPPEPPAREEEESPAPPTDAIAEEIAAHQATVPGVSAPGPEGDEEPETEAERSVDAPAEGMRPPEPQPDPAPAETDEPPDAGLRWPGVSEDTSEPGDDHAAPENQEAESAEPTESGAADPPSDQEPSDDPPPSGEPRSEP